MWASGGSEGPAELFSFYLDLVTLKRMEEGGDTQLRAVLLCSHSCDHREVSQSNALQMLHACPRGAAFLLYNSANERQKKTCV